MSEQSERSGTESAIDPSQIASLSQELGKVPAFAELAQPDLEWVVAQCTLFRAAPGERMIQEGTPADRMYILLEGEVRGRRESAGPDSPVFTVSAGNVGGLLPFSRMKIFTVTTRAVKPARALAFPSKKFSELIHRLPDLAQRLVGLLADRVRDFTRIEQQTEKLAALGKLSAGLAHELNNPSAAARRSASALRDCLQRLRDASRNSEIGPEDCGALAAREEQIRNELKPAEYKDEFVRVEREEAIQSWLEAQHVADAWKLAPSLAEANLTDEHLKSFVALAGPSLGPELQRFGTLLEMERIADELEQATVRISELIKAIKEYSYMDQSPLQEVNIKKSLETTLTIMNHKLKRGIAIKREYAPDVPLVMAYGSELNQVWTNLIDNAADAMKDKGTLTIRTIRENDYVVVEIADTGPGIPAEVQSRIFEPFFTTKGVGEGTGLGLDVVYRIVQKHRGLVTLKSEPGFTRFSVRIPIQSAL
ncbi:MAG TPA: ATP-binding protein [Candidatus Dormibacteraeota bacterium]|nr:ATP-binding protein [Candidatus Dormibacteraeota bacterium]